METTDAYAIDPKLSFAEVVVPTVDSVRNTYLLHLLLMKQKHVLMVGGTGTGKTINISQYLMGAARVNKNETIDPNCVPFTITFSAQTSANMTQVTNPTSMYQPFLHASSANVYIDTKCAWSDAPGCTPTFSGYDRRQAGEAA
jgi:hypothetical protein